MRVLFINLFINNYQALLVSFLKLENFMILLNELSMFTSGSIKTNHYDVPNEQWDQIIISGRIFTPSLKVLQHKI